jgi:penicillin-binding protein 2
VNTLGFDAARFRLTVIGLVVVALFAAVFVRLWYLQVLNASAYRKAAVVNNVRPVFDPATRGVVVAREGTVLVGNQVTETVTLSQNQAVLHPAVVGRVAALLGMTTAQVKQRLNSPQYSPYRPVPIASGVPMSMVIELREHQSEYPGVSAQPTAVPDYPYGSLAAQLLGYTGPISATELKALKAKGYRAGEIIGQDGVEASYDQWLEGKPGVTRYSVDAQGQVVSTLSSTPPQAGDDIQLTLDLPLQQQVQADLQNEMNALRGTTDTATGLPVKATDGAAVVLNPNNGQVLAMASIPSYDPSVWTNGISEAQYQALIDPANGEPLINRAIAGLYTPGSTFKLATATAALDSGIISPSYVWDDTGTFTVPNCTAGQCVFHDAETSGAGPINIVTALAASVDTFFYNLGYLFYTHQSQYGATPIQTTASQYGLGVASGIDLPGEASGGIDSQALRVYDHTHYPKYYPYDTWFAGDQVEMAFGQGETVITPLQLATAYATFANGGTRYVPHVVSDIVDPATGQVAKQFQPVVAGHVNLPPQVRTPLLQGFEGAVASPLGTSYGTFQGFPLTQLQVAGKTGTASHLGPNGQQEVPTSLFVGFAPATNPQYVVAVVIDQGGYGASGAAPVARQVFLYLMTNPPSPLSAPTSAQLGQPSVSVGVPATASTTAPARHAAKQEGPSRHTSRPPTTVTRRRG